MESADPYSNLTVNRYLKEALEGWAKERNREGLPMYSVANVVNRLIANFCIIQKIGDAQKIKNIEEALIDASRDTHPSPTS